MNFREWGGNMKKIIMLFSILCMCSVIFCAAEKETQEVGVDSNGKKIFMEIEKLDGKIIRETEIDENGKKIKVYNFTQYDKDGYPTTAEIYDGEGRYILKLQINYTNDGKISFHMDAKNNVDNSQLNDAQDIKKKIEKIYYDEQYIKKRNAAIKNKSERIANDFEKNKISSNDEFILNYQLSYNLENRMFQDTVTAEIITDAMREFSGCDIAFFNSMKINGDLKKGENSYRDVKSLTSEENLCLMEMSGSEILKLLSDVLSNEKDYLNFSGITVENVNGNVQNAVVNGESIDIDKIYSVAVNSYVCYGEGIFQYMKTRKIKCNTDIKVYELTARKVKKIRKIDNKYVLEIRNKNIKK